jgi:serine/threonine protein kinase
VIRADRATPKVVQRCRREAEILGRLQHAGIAQVYEAGVAADGRPYFAMEFIHGVPLDEYARRDVPGCVARPWSGCGPTWPAGTEA